MLSLLSSSRERLCIWPSLFSRSFRPFSSDSDAASRRSLAPQLQSIDRHRGIGDVKLRRRGVNCPQLTSAIQPSFAVVRRRRHRHSMNSLLTIPSFSLSFALLNNSHPPRHGRRGCSPRGCHRHGAPRGACRQVRREFFFVVDFFLFRVTTTAAARKKTHLKKLNLFLLNSSKPTAPATAASAPTSPRSRSSSVLRPTSARPRPRSRASRPASSSSPLT